CHAIVTPQEYTRGSSRCTPSALWSGDIVHDVAYRILVGEIPADPAAGLPEQSRRVRLRTGLVAGAGAGPARHRDQLSGAR
nr:hypothetical protein [Tanacetum cinerariifolium]